MNPQLQMFVAFGLAGFFSAILFGLSLAWRRRWWVRSLWPVAGGIAFLAASAILLPKFPWPLLSANERMLAILPVLGVLLGLLDRLPPWIARGGCLVIAIVGALVLVYPKAMLPEAYGLSMAAATGWVLVPATVAALMASLLNRLSRDEPRVTVPLILLGLAACVGPILMTTGTLATGRLSMVHAGAVGVIAIGSVLVGSKIALSRIDRVGGTSLGVCAFAVIGSTFFLLIGSLYNQTPILTSLVVASCPLVALVARWPWLRRRAAWVRVVIVVGWVAVPATVMVGLALQKFNRASGATGSPSGSLSSPSDYLKGR